MHLCSSCSFVCGCMCCNHWNILCFAKHFDRFLYLRLETGDRVNTLNSKEMNLMCLQKSWNEESGSTASMWVAVGFCLL